MRFAVYIWDYDLDCYFLHSDYATLEEAEETIAEFSSLPELEDYPYTLKIWAIGFVPMALDWTGNPTGLA